MSEVKVRSNIEEVANGIGSYISLLVLHALKILFGNLIFKFYFHTSGLGLDPALPLPPHSKAEHRDRAPLELLFRSDSRVSAKLILDYLT